MGESTDRESAIVPRSNARPLRFDELTSEQQSAYTRTLRLLVGMADESGPAFGNRVVLLDGGRGSGKTTILLTVNESMRANLRGAKERPASASRLVGDARSAKESLVDDHGAQGLFDRHRDVRLIPLELLDLHTLPKGPSILQHIASRITAAVFTGDREPDGLWRTPHSPLSSLRQTLDRFVQAIGQGWDLDPLARSGLSDPETITHQTRTAADAWRRVDELFARVVDDVCDALVDVPRPKSKPLLVLPIDDADMNPERSIELLGIMRALNHQRFAYLLTGHTDLFLEQLRIWFLGRIRQPLAAVRFHRDESKPLPLQSLAPTLGFDYFDRVIPPDHRCSVPEIEGQGRWKVLRKVFDSLKESSAGNGLGDDGLHALGRVIDNEFLVRALPSRRRALENLGRLIVRDIEERTNKRRQDPAGAEKSVEPSSAQERVAVVAHRLWRDALYRGPLFQSGMLNPEPLVDVVKLPRDADDEASASLSLRVETRALQLRYAYWEQPLLNIEAFNTPVVFADAAVLRPWSVRARLADEPWSAEDHEFSDAVSASFQFAIDAARSLKSARAVRPDLGRRPRPEPPVDEPPALLRTRIRLRDVAEPVSVHWTLLDFERYFEAYQFGSAFRRALELREHTSLDQAAKLVVRYASSRRIEDRDADERLLREAKSADLSWSEVLRPFLEESTQFAKVAADFVHRREMVLDVNSFRAIVQRLGAQVGRVGLSWGLFQLPLFASPEFGMPVSEAASLLAALREAWVGLPMGPERSFWDQVCEVLVEERRTLLRKALREHFVPREIHRRSAASGASAAYDTALADLTRVEDQYFSGPQEPHPWFREIERTQRTDRVGSGLKVFSAQLARYFFDRSEFSRGPAITNLSQYFEQVQSRTRQLRMSIETVPSLVAPLLRVIDDALLSANGGRMLSERVSELSQAVFEGWRALSDKERPVHHYVDFRSDGRVVFSLDIVREEFEQRAVAGAVVRSFARGIVSTAGKRAPARDLGLAHDLYFRLCRDLASDGFVYSPLSRGKTEGNALFEKESHGVRAVWRDVAWSSLFDCELFDEYWRTVIAETLGVAAPKIDDAERVDVLAYAWLLGIAHVAMRRKQPVQTRWERSPRLQAWQRAIQSLFVDGSPARAVVSLEARLLDPWRDSERANVFESWRQGALLIAAPESGVSVEAARMILQAYFGSSPMANESAKRESGRLRGARVARQVNEAMSQAEARDLLVEFDKRPEWQAHPWFEYVGRTEAGDGRGDGFSDGQGGGSGDGRGGLLPPDGPATARAEPGAAVDPSPVKKKPRSGETE
jgi:hypothetical protein